MAATQLDDIIIPERFDRYTQNRTAELSALIRSGAIVRDPGFSTKLNGGGLTFNMPSWKPLSRVAANVITDNVADRFGGYASSNNSQPQKIETLEQVAVGLRRHQSWSSVNLVDALTGENPLAAIQALVSDYWIFEQQDTFIALMQGLFADNDLAPDDAEHVVGDLTFDATTPGEYQEGVTDFNATNFQKALLTMGDNSRKLSLVMMHSIVEHRAKLNNLIDYRPDSNNPDAEEVPFFLGRRVIVDDAMPNDGSEFETWFFGQGAVKYGQGSPEANGLRAVELQREADAGNGGGQDVLHNRVVWGYHPEGFRFDVSASGGGPDNSSDSGQLAHAASWKRVYPERKQIAIARLKTIEVPA